MGEIKFMKGNDAQAEADIRAGMQGYFGYPITSQYVDAAAKAMMANAHMHQYGTTLEQLSQVSVKNHHKYASIQNPFE